MTISDGGEDEEEQLRPLQGRRTSPRQTFVSTKVTIPASPSPLSSSGNALEEHLSLEVREEVPNSIPTTDDEVSLENSDSSWLLLGFEMPTKE